MRHPGPLACAVLLLSLATTGSPAAPVERAGAKMPAAFASATRGSEHVAGFFDVYRDAANGRVLLDVRQLDTPFLLISSLPWGLGSNDIGLDRG